MRIIKDKSELMLQVEKKIGGNVEEALRKMYVDDNMSVRDISAELGVSYVTTHRWLKKAGVRSRRVKVGSK